MTNYFWAVWVEYPDGDPFIIMEVSFSDFMLCGRPHRYDREDFIIIEPVVPCKKKVNQ